MKIKTIIVLLCFTIAIIGIISPVNAKLDASISVHSHEPINGKTGLDFGVYSTIGKSEFSKINKIVLSIKGYKSKTYKKTAKGWSSKYDSGNSYIYIGTSVNGKALNKDYSVKLYDKKGKLIKNIKRKVEGQ
jgi:hypothetical protein